MAVIEDQQFCLRWNNFQANFTSQFETLRDDEDFTDVTIACEGQKLQAHKVVLSACSPYFKELFKTNPCSHPIIFMKDVEAQHIVALMEFMYAGEVNVAQANLSAFLKTAESLKIRGLTDTSTSYDNEPPKEEDTLYLNPQSSKHSISRQKSSKPHISSSSTVTSSQDVPKEMSPSPSPPPKRQCKSVSDVSRPRPVKEEVISGVNPFAIQTEVRSQLEIISKSPLEPKIELPDYSSDDETREDISNYYGGSELTELPGGTEIIPQNLKGATPELTLQSADSRKLHSLDPRPCEECGRVYSNLSNLRQHMKLIHYPTYVNCDICSKSFKTDLYLRRHMIGAHNNVQNRSFTDTKPVLSLNRVKMELTGFR
ncbi:modifier of mdg4-like isoform X2 [Harmonia axyridis]|uniref:modifier of mdg4-like isoform X2 n=1 Tax=Harmonia axyridis TaxID=115357 RepID=UPI001E27525C|nr:modifier of mdg4-like isoform X2 [Harmonia axyridis]